ncbi:hypothetical protein R69776_03378 [Paraburkholderia nemoris]|uniref:Uncharacterized protein n=1 Tax=Paraburkholderia nemoris TaxID=2793076 RepID=A0ABM8RMP7_9BURK|nr:hypothetical protein R69776_03378 [Paraburkholderia nemoris]
MREQQKRSSDAYIPPLLPGYLSLSARRFAFSLRVGRREQGRRSAYFWAPASLCFYLLGRGGVNKR